MIVFSLFNKLQYSFARVSQKNQVLLKSVQKKKKKEGEFIEKGFDKLQQKEQQLIQENYKAGFTPQEVEPYNEMVKKALRLNNASPSEITQFKVQQAIEKFKTSPRDTSSPAIQVVVKTEKILTLLKHCQQFRSDKLAAKSLRETIQERRQQLNSLRIKDYHRYKWICEEYCIPDVAPKYGHHKEFFRLKAKPIPYLK